jgi:outer membrane receptor protein involved in Fe transport
MSTTNRILIRAGLAGLLLLAISVASWSGTVGKITGIVTDAKTGEPLPAAAITIPGTTMGAEASATGEFYILNVPAGAYDVKASHLGYKDILLKDVLVAPDFTARVEFKLQQTTAVVYEAVEVGAERALVQRDKTTTARFLEGKDLQNQPIRGYQDAASLQAGVTAEQGALRGGGGVQLEEATNAPRLYMRGGRSDETAYYVDGFSQQDPLTGISTVGINQNAIQQVVVMTGGFDAEYGKIMSGAVNVITKEGSDKLTGSMEAVTDNLGGSWVGAKKYDYNLYSLQLDGPIPVVRGLHFSASGERTWEGDRTPKPVDQLGLTTAQENLYKNGRLPGNFSNGYSWQGKLAWDANRHFKFKAGAIGSWNKWKEYRHSYLFDIAHSPLYLDTNNSVFGTMTHTVSSRLFYELSANWFSTERYRGDGVYFKDQRAYGVNGEAGNPNYDQYLPLFFYGPDHTGGSIWDDYLHRKSSYIGGRGDVTYQWMQHHTGKAGVEYRRHTLRRYQNLYPVNSYKPDAQQPWVDVDHYGYSADGTSEVNSGLDGAKHPVDATVYFQDKYEKEDFVLRAGLRYDYLAAKTQRLRNDALPLGTDRARLDPAQDLISSKAWNKLSPRIGVGFPIGEGLLFHANYGKFFQQPNLENLYVSYQYLEHKVVTGGYFFPFGNPSLQPEETTAYEIGTTKQLAQNASLDVVVFYKDIRNLTEVQNIPASPNNYSSYRNQDYGTVKGLDFSLDIRKSHDVSATIFYTLSWANGTGSAPNFQRNVAWTAGPNVRPPRMTSPLDFDQRHKLTVNMDWRTEKGGGPLIAGRHWLEKAGLNALLNLASGNPYTSVKPYDEVSLASTSVEPSAPLNAGNGPWTFRVDLKADRAVSVGGRDLDFYVWVMNLFNRKNPVNVYQVSGDAYTSGWLSDPRGEASYSTPEDQALYRLKERNPNNFDIPRLVRFGVRVSF